MNNHYLTVYIIILILFLLFALLVGLFKFNNKFLNKLSLKVKLFFYLTICLTLLQMIVVLLLIKNNLFNLFNGFYYYIFIFFFIEWLLIYVLVGIIFKSLSKTIKLVKTGVKKHENVNVKSLESEQILSISNNAYFEYLNIKNKLKNYLSFVPKEYYQIIKDEQKRNIELYKAILVVDLKSSFYYSETVSLNKNFANLNKAISAICSFIYKFDGIVDNFAGDGVLAVFTKPDKAFLAAKNILNNRNLKNMVKTALHYGKIQICELGPNYRKTLTAISSEVNKTFKIEKINKKLGTCLLFTKSFLNSLQTDKNINYRYVGSFLCDDGVEKVALFEVLTNDFPLKYIKMFESGVRLYEKGEISESFGVFNSLKINNFKDNVLNYYLKIIKK